MFTQIVVRINWKYDVTIGRDGPVPVSLRFVWMVMLKWAVLIDAHRSADHPLSDCASKNNGYRYINSWFCAEHSQTNAAIYL